MGLRHLQSRVKKRKQQLKIPQLYARSFAKTIGTDPTKNARTNAHSSWPERVVANILTVNNIKYVKEYQILNKFYDFYLVDLKILIEVDGIFWHGKYKHQNTMKVWEIKAKVNDIVKNSVAYAKNLVLLRIWEDEISEKHLMNLINYAVSSKAPPGLLIIPVPEE